MTETHSIDRTVSKTGPIDDSLIKELSNDDDAQLNNLGIAPTKVERNFNIWSLLFMSFCTSVTWEAISSAAAQALTSGGSSSLVWGFAASATGALLIVLCIAEYASMIPTAGGQYHYVAKLAPPKYRRIFAWYAGWITMIGWVLCATAGIFATAMQIQSWAILFSEGYVYERWHTSLIVIALTSLYTLFAIFDIKRLHYMIFLAMFGHVFGYLATAIYLLVHTHPKNSAEYVFTDATNLSGWENSGVAWSIGLLTSTVSFVGWDSSTHMAEEMKNASRDLPRTMIANVAVSGILTFPWVIAVAFCFTNLGDILAGPVGRISPFAQLYYNVSGGSQAATIGLTSFLPILGFCGTGTAIISSTSRVIWSFARDGGLPEYFARVGDRTKAPTGAIILTWALISLISLIYIGNATAYYGISSACTAALIISYAFPILINAVCGFQHCNVPRGPFTLGRYHRPIALAALAWSIYITIFLCFPTIYPVTAANLNYAAPVLGIGFLMTTIGWFAYGKSGYIGIEEVIDGRHQ
ncbi:amino acid/polyamine transporter I [Penicillium concentricum]|uniref:Amino acid/polyamine transporter I n=1 Tax=Penicillium concentricum TaxID=293559 RepID=A0A9W9VI05_9EURO|nr:amino acid/polyamine transporter I [Penicillium concentricum]KAJ5382632.1 amino acid/polyamine transporter I [Penicillium concentricum]